MTSKETFRRIVPNGTPPRSQRPPSAVTGSGSMTSAGVKRPLRVNQACNSCRKLKVRCEGADRPPCANCRSSNTECLFDRKENADVNCDVEGRLHVLESKIDSIKETQVQIQEMLREMFNVLRRPSETCQDTTPSSQSDYNPHLTTIEQYTGSPSKSVNDVTSDNIDLSGLISASDGPSKAASDFSFSQTLSQGHGEVLLARDGNVVQDNLSLGSLLNGHSPITALSGMDDFTNFWMYGDTTYKPPHWMGNNFTSTIPENVSYVLQTTDATSLIEARPSLDRIPLRRSQIQISTLRDLLCEDDPPPWIFANSNYDNKEDVVVLDAVSLGLLSEAEAIALWEIYFTGDSAHSAIFDSRVDTFASLKARSPACFNCILMVASKIRDGANDPSDLQQQLCSISIRGVQKTMFHRLNSLESIQAMFLAATWVYPIGGPGWLAIGHTIRLAIDLGLHRSIKRLSDRMEADDMEATDSNILLIRAARVWVALYSLELQICNSTGRIPITGGWDTIRDIRRVFLRHPLVRPSDVRLVSGSELHTLVYDMMKCMAMSWRTEPLSMDLLNNWQSRIDAWHVDWENILGQQFSFGGLERACNDINRSSAYLTVFGLHAYGLRLQFNDKEVSTELRRVCTLSINAARNILEISVRNADYREYLRHALPHTRAITAYVGFFLLRISRVLPSIIDPLEATELAEGLVDALSRSTTGLFIRQIKELVAENRKTAHHPTTSLSPYHSDPMRLMPTADINRELRSNTGFPLAPCELETRPEYYMPSPAVALSNMAAYDSLKDTFPQYNS